MYKLLLTDILIMMIINRNAFASVSHPSLVMPLGGVEHHPCHRQHFCLSEITVRLHLCVKLYSLITVQRRWLARWMMIGFFLGRLSKIGQYI